MLAVVSHRSAIVDTNKPVKQLVGAGVGAFPSMRSMRDRPLPVPGVSDSNFVPSNNGHGSGLSSDPGLAYGQPSSQLQSDRCDFRTIQKTCALFGLDLVSFPKK